MGILANEINQLEAVLRNMRNEQARAAKALIDESAKSAKARQKQNAARLDADRMRSIVHDLENALTDLRKVDEDASKTVSN